MFTSVKSDYVTKFKNAVAFSMHGIFSPSEDKITVKCIAAFNKYTIQITLIYLS